MNNLLIGKYNLTPKRLGQALTFLWASFINGILLQNGKLYVYVCIWQVQNLLWILKNSCLLKADSLADIVVSDIPKAIDGRFTITYCFWNYKLPMRIFIRTFANIFSPIVSASSYYPAAGWLEREAWDMYGIKFYMHPDLRRILSDYGFVGHPLRKDFPLIGFVEIRYDDSYRSIVFDPVELTQELRFFKFELTWLKNKVASNEGV